MFCFIEDNFGNKLKRAVLDRASNTNVSLKDCANVWKLGRKLIYVPSTGLNGYAHNVKYTNFSVISNENGAFMEKNVFPICSQNYDCNSIEAIKCV